MDRYTVGTDMAHKPFTLTPLEPRGGRYIELHALLDDEVGSLEHVLLLSPSQALYRSYGPYQEDPKAGAFSIPGDTLLTQIWKTGVDTTRSCVEDTCVDGPCRERGQWLGDSAAVSLPNLVYVPFFFINRGFRIDSPWVLWIDGIVLLLVGARGEKQGRLGVASEGLP